MVMFAKIVADSINQFNNRITTYIVYIPYALLNDFIQYDISGVKAINVTHKRLKSKEYTPSIKNMIDDYNWNSGIDFLKKVKQNMISYSLGYVGCIMTSTKWYEFFCHMLSKVDNEFKSTVPRDFVDLLINMEESYISNRKNAKALKSDEWHISPHIDVMVNSLNVEKGLLNKTKVMYQYYAYSQLNLNPSAKFTHQLVVNHFPTAKLSGNINLCNHIVKVPVDYNYLTNGSFNSVWDNKLQMISRPYNTMFDSYLCLYDIIERLNHLQT